MKQMVEKSFKLADAVKGFILALTLLEAPTFFAVYAILGKTYEGSESSKSYVAYIGLLLIVQVYYFFRKRRIERIEFVWLFVPLMFALLAWFVAWFYHTEVNAGVIMNILLWQYTGIFLAINIHAYQQYDYLLSSFVILMFLITAGAVMSLLVQFLRGQSFFAQEGYSLSGNSLQSQSYYIAVASGLNLFFFAIQKKTKWTQVLAFAVLAIQLICGIPVSYTHLRAHET